MLTRISFIAAVMREAVWRRCLWGLCLVAVAAAAAAELAAGQQAACEVLDSRVQSTFPLPTNLTLRPSGRQWQVDFVLQQTDQRSTVCVNVKQNTSIVRLKLIEGTCGGGIMIDYGYIKGVNVLPHAWTTLSVEVRDNEVLVASSGSAPVALQGGDTPLPRDALQVVGAAQGVKVAVGCRVNCPHYNYSSDRGQKMNVLVTQQEDVLFYFRPGEHFTRLQYVVECATPKNIFKYHHITDIKPPLPGRWYVVGLQHRSGVARLTLNYERHEERHLPQHCVFTRHTVRMEGQALFSFSCNPTSGAPEWGGIEQCGGNTCSVKDQVTTPCVAVVVTVVLAVGIGAALYCCVLQRR